MRLPSFFKKTSFRIAATISALALIIAFAFPKDTLADKAKKVSFPGMTHVNINYTMKNLNLEKLSTAETDLATHQLTQLSSYFVDKKTNLIFTIVQSADQRVLFTVIKNNKVIQLQKINEITEKGIALQYGKITLNTEKPLVASNNATDIF